jgi:NTE family protein
VATVSEAEPTADAPGSAPGRARRSTPAPRTVLLVASLGAVAAFIDATIVNIAFPDMEASFHGTSVSTLSWVLNVYNIVFAAFLVAGGRLSDLVGRKRVFLFAVALFTVASALCGVAPSPEALIGFRALQALGAALLVPSSLALVLAAFPAARRAHAVALWTAIGAAAAGIGPSLGGVLVQVSDWRLVFYVNLPIGIAALVLGRMYLVESRAPGKRLIPDLPGAVLFALGISAIVLAVTQGTDWGWTSVKVIGCFVAAIVLLGVFGWRCSWHRSPLIDLAVLRIRSFAVANVLTIVGAAGFYGYTLINVLFLTGVWRYSVLDAGLAMTPGPFVAAAVAGPSSRLAERFGHRFVIVPGGLIWSGAVLWFVLRVGVQPNFVGVWLPGIILLGVGAGILFPNLSGAAIAAAPGDQFGTASGLNSVARQIGAALGVAIAVAVLGTPGPLEAASAFDHAWTFSALALGFAGLGGFFIGRLKTEPAPSLRDAARDAWAEAAGAPLVPALPPRRPLAATPPEGEPRPETVGDFLARLPLFADVPPALRDRLAARARDRRVEAGEWLFREGDPGDELFVVRSGRLQVVAGDVVLRELGRGDAVGELALLTDTPRSAAIRAGRTSELIAIDRAAFDGLLDEAPALSRALNRALGLQLRASRAATEAPRGLPTTIALVPLGVGADARALAADLAIALGDAAVLDGGEVEGDSVAHFGPLLDRAEAVHDRVLLVTGSPLPDADPWTRFALAQADRILVLAGGAVPAGLHGVAELRGCELVVGGAPVGGWADLLGAVGAHVARGADDVARLARRLSGRSVGLVLSGGGARAFAHIGVLEELEAAGVRIDRVGGVGMGAFVGALAAQGLDAEEIDARCYDEWVRRRPLGDWTVPRHALSRGERLTAMLRRTFGDTLIETLPRSFFCASADLRSGELVVHRTGALAAQVGASMRTPILAPPEVRGERLLVEGSLVDNLPVGAMAALGEGPIVAVDIQAGIEGPADGPPSLAETLSRVLLLAERTHHAARTRADLLIEPVDGGIGLLEFHQIDAAREAGRAAARAALERAPGALLR